jgi:hypothetical protein
MEKSYGNELTWGDLLKAVIIFACLTASYFLVIASYVFVLVPILTSHPIPELSYLGGLLIGAILESIVFSVMLLIVRIFSRRRLWRAFWIASIAQILLHGGGEIYSGLTLAYLARGGEPLWINGHVTSFGVAALAFDVAVAAGIFVSSNFLGFYTSRRVMARIEFEKAKNACVSDEWSDAERDEFKRLMNERMWS